MIETAVSTNHNNRQHYLDQLIAFLRIPSISTLSEHQASDIQ